MTRVVRSWFSGRDAEQVMTTATAGMGALIVGDPFEVDGPCLVATTNGVVNCCVYSDAACLPLPNRRSQPLFDRRLGPG